MQHLISITTEVTSQLDGIDLLIETSVHEAFGIQTLNVSKKHGEGTIKSFNFNNGMLVNQYNLSIFNDQTFSLCHNNKDYLYFFYGLNGTCYHNFKNKEKYTIIEELQTAIVGVNKQNESEITIKKNGRFNFTIISIDKNTYFKNFQSKYNPPLDKIKKLNKAFKVLDDYLYQCSHNLKVAEQLRYIKNNSLEFQITCLLHFESYFQIIFSIQIEQFYKEVYEERITTSLTKTELQKVRKLTEYIIDNPSLNYTIKKLCSQALLAPVKLQEGFRCLHGTTVSNYIKNIRIDKARDLLIYSDYNISEISYMVGFSSRSYFCKIFKEKFGYNAMAYKDKYKDNFIALEREAQ